MVAAIRIMIQHYHTQKLQLYRFIHTWVTLKALFPPIHFSTVTLFIYLQGFERQRDQGAPGRDIFKSPFLANTVSEQSTISLFFSINYPEVNDERSIDYLQFGFSFLSFLFLGLYGVFFRHNPLCPYKLEAIILSSGTSFYLFPSRYICFAFRPQPAILPILHSVN